MLIHVNQMLISYWQKKYLIVSKILHTFAIPKRRDPLRGEDWCGSSAWLEYLPVTQGVAGSSPVRTAKKDVPNTWSSFSFFNPYRYI